MPGRTCRNLSVLCLVLMIGSCGGRRITFTDAGDPQGAAPAALDAALREEVPSRPSTPGCQGRNEGCARGEFCDFRCDSDAGWGTCRPRPPLESCPMFDDPCPIVCGCDGNAYCSECEANAAGVPVRGADLSCMSCEEIEDRYLAAVKRAKTCSEDSLDEPCTVAVWDRLGGSCPCPCPTSVNPANSEALAWLEELRQVWTAKGCGPPPGLGECCDLYPACADVPGQHTQCGATGACVDGLDK